MHQAQVFRLLAQDLAGLLTVERLADHLSALADLVLRGHDRAAPGTSCRGAHREGAPRFAVIAYGKLGGKELGYASDLDIVFLYDDPHEQAPEVYCAPRAALNTWLTTRTSAGVLFDTDLALRPSGACGPAGVLARGVRALPGARRLGLGAPGADARALLRRRRGGRRAFEAIRESILRRSRDPAELAARDHRDAREDARRASRTAPGCSTSSTTAAA